MCNLMFRAAKLILAVLTIPALVHAAGEYRVVKTVTGTSSYQLTFLVPPGKQIRGDMFDVSASGAFIVEFLRGGTTPTTTAVTPKRDGSTIATGATDGTPDGTTLIYDGSNSTGGVVLSRYKVYSAGFLPLDWSRRMYAAGQLLTIKVTAVSGTVDVQINGTLFEER